MTAYLQLGSDRAAYAVALQDGYSTEVVKPDVKFRGGQLPSALPHVSDLNFLHPASSLFHTDIALVSFGQYIGTSMGHGMLHNRVRGKSLIIGDSGGYQFAKATKVWSGDLTRRAALKWCEANTDVSMTLDIPTKAIAEPKSGFSDFKSCLETSVESLRYYMNNRTGSMRLLNVLQGRSQDEADAWFAAARNFSCEGWAFAGDLRQNFYQVCRRLLQMIDAGLIGPGRKHIHVLGTARLSTAVALTALQRALRKNVHESIFITFDAATPSILASNYKAIWAPTLSAREFLFRANKVPCTSDYAGSQTPFPFGSSAVARRLLLRDLCVNSSPVKQASFDVLSSLLLTNHNVESLLAAIGAANGVADFIGRDREAFVPPSLLRGLEAIGRVFEGDTGRRLVANRKVLENLAVVGDEAPERVNDFETFGV